MLDREFFKTVLEAHAEEVVSGLHTPWPRIDVTLQNGETFWVNRVVVLTPAYAIFRQEREAGRKDWAVPYQHIAYVTFDTTSQVEFGFRTATSEQEH
jgi:hypothetical protein